MVFGSWMIASPGPEDILRWRVSASQDLIGHQGCQALGTEFDLLTICNRNIWGSGCLNIAASYYRIYFEVTWIMDTRWYRLRSA
jgi:hypothetical protein